MKETTATLSDLGEWLAQAEFIWDELRIGDLVEVEDPVVDEGAELLTPGTPYMLVAKAEGERTLLVECDQPGRLVRLHPHQLASYHDGLRIPLC